MINWSSEDIEWKKQATDFQQDLFEKLGDRYWDYIKKNERLALEKKVGFALFGEPANSPTEENKTGYNSEQMTNMCHICNLIYKHSGSLDVYVAFLFVIGKTATDKYRIPVIKFRADKEEVFIDNLGRIYKNWSDFKSNNKLPKSLVCYPLDGTYQSDEQNNVLLEFSTSPACALVLKIYDKLDTITTGVGFGATGITVAGLFVTVAAPLAIASTIGVAATGFYGLFRASQSLHDRGRHSQTISPMNKDARNCWLSVLGGAFGIGSSVAVSRVAALAANGRLIGKTGQCIVNFFNFGALTVNGLGVANGLAILVEKKQNKQLFTLDVFQWTTSVFFFYNAAINIQTANGIVKDVQEGIKADFSSGLSKRRMKSFKRVMKETSADTGNMKGNAKLIKGISNIESKDEFFRLVIKGQKYDKGIKFNQDGYLMTKGQTFFDRIAGVNYPINYKVGGNFINVPGGNLKCNNKLCNETLELMEKVKAENKKNSIIIDENRKFELKAELLTKLSKVFFKYSNPEQNKDKKKEEIHNTINQSENFAQDIGCPSEKTFVSYSEFICIYKQRKLQKMIKLYEMEKSELISLFGEQFNLAVLHRKWGIQGYDSIEEVFKERINQEISNSNADLKAEFHKYISDVEILNESGNVKFHTSTEALIQFYRCFVIDCNETMTLHEYFDIIRQTVQDENLRVCANEKDCKHIFYYDNTIPVVVEVKETDCGLFFETTSFQEPDEPNEAD